MREPSDERARKVITRYRRLLTTSTAPPMYPGIRCFLVVRDPYTRAVSSFVDKFCGEDREMSYVREVVEECNVESPTFIDFLQYLLRTPIDLQNAHWTPQTYIMRGMPNATLLRLEALQVEMAEFADLWGDRDLGVLSLKAQSNLYEGHLDAGAAADMTAETLIEYRKKNGGFPRKDAFLSPEAKELIRSGFGEDLKHFKGLYP